MHFISQAINDVSILTAIICICNFYRFKLFIGDISITNGFSVQISAMIGHFFEIQPEAVKFYHFIRIWLKINKVSFKQFTLTLLVMNFLQEENLLPTAFNAQKNVPQDYIEGKIL